MINIKFINELLSPSIDRIVKRVVKLTERTFFIWTNFLDVDYIFQDRTVENLNEHEI